LSEFKNIGDQDQVDEEKYQKAKEKEILRLIGIIVE